jgi:hypothetical protein
VPKKTYRRIGGTWKEIINIWRKVGTVWHDNVISWIKVAGVWKKCFFTGVILYDHDFISAAPVPSDAVRFYYVQADTAPYNGLVYLNYGTNIVFHKDHDDWGSISDLILARTTAGTQIPDPHPSYPTHTWPLVCAVIYTSGDGKYRKYLITEAAGGDDFLNAFEIDPAMGFAYYLDYEKELAGWPATLADL